MLAVDKFYFLTFILLQLPYNVLKDTLPEILTKMEHGAMNKVVANFQSGKLKVLK